MSQKCKVGLIFLLGVGLCLPRAFGATGQDADVGETGQSVGSPLAVQDVAEPLELATNPDDLSAGAADNLGVNTIGAAQGLSPLPTFKALSQPQGAAVNPGRSAPRAIKIRRGVAVRAAAQSSAQSLPVSRIKPAVQAPLPQGEGINNPLAREAGEGRGEGAKSILGEMTQQLSKPGASQEGVLREYVEGQQPEAAAVSASAADVPNSAGRQSGLLASVLKPFSAVINSLRRPAVPSVQAPPKVTPLPDILKFGEELRARHIDPRETNIPEFAALIPKHLAFARDAIKKQRVDHDRLGILDRFEAEANQRLAEQKVTYEWWNNFNFRLAILMTPSTKRSGSLPSDTDSFYADLLKKNAWQTNEGFGAVAAAHEAETANDHFSTYGAYSVASKFPEVVSIPSLNGVLKIKDQNAMFGADVNVIGLIGTKTIADGQEMWPDHYFLHDIVHAANELFYADSNRRHMQQEYLAYRDALSGPRRWLFEAGYWLATHESGVADSMQHDPRTSLATVKELPSLLRNPLWYDGLVPQSIRSSNRAVTAYIRKMDAELELFFRPLRAKAESGSAQSSASGASVLAAAPAATLDAAVMPGSPAFLDLSLPEAMQTLKDHDQIHEYVWNYFADANPSGEEGKRWRGYLPKDEEAAQEWIFAIHEKTGLALISNGAIGDPSSFKSHAVQYIIRFEKQYNVQIGGSGQEQFKNLMAAAGRNLQGEEKIHEFVVNLLEREFIGGEEGAEKIYDNLPSDLADRDGWINAIYRETGWAWQPSRHISILTQAFDYVSRRPTQAGKDAVLSMAADALRGKGVKFERWHNKLVILGDDGKKAQALNRFAAAVKNRYGVMVEFSPSRLMSLNASGYFDAQAIGISPSAVLMGRPMPLDETTSSHEGLHAENNKRFQAGKRDPVAGSINGLDSLGLVHSTYSKYFSLDELDTFDLDQKTFAAWARAAAFRYIRGKTTYVPPSDINDLLKSARGECADLIGFSAAVEKADARLLDLAAQLRKSPLSRFMREDYGPPEMNLRDAALSLSNGNLEIKFKDFSYSFPTALTERSPEWMIAAAIESQARGLDAIAAKKSSAAQSAKKAIEDLMPQVNYDNLKAMRANLQAGVKSPEAKKLTDEFDALQDIERGSPTTARQRAVAAGLEDAKYNRYAAASPQPQAALAPQEPSASAAAPSASPATIEREPGSIAVALGEIKKMGKSEGAEAVLWVAEQTLKQRNVKYMRGFQRIVILPEGSAPLNRFAASMWRQYEVEVEFSPNSLVNMGANAYFNHMTDVLGLPVQIIMNGRLSAAQENVLAHEIRHVADHHKLSAGSLDVIHGKINGLSSFGLADPSYGSSFDLGELKEYSADQKAHIAKARAAYLRYLNGASLSDDVSSLLQATNKIGTALVQWGAAVEKADAALLSVAEQLRADSAARFTPDRLGHPQMRLANATVTLQEHNFVPGLAVRLLDQPGVAYSFPTVLTQAASAQDVADFLEHQAMDIDAFAAGKAQIAQALRDPINRLLPSLKNARAADPEKTKQAFDELLSIARGK